MSATKILRDSLNYVTETLQVPHDQRLNANLHMLLVNAKQDPALWQQLLDHICWPEENPFPEGLFLTDNPPGYTRIMQVLEELYDE